MWRLASSSCKLVGLWGGRTAGDDSRFYLATDELNVTWTPRHENDDSDEDRERKRLRKEADKAAKMLGYSNEANPFGDSNLLEPFVWGKKLEKSKKQGKRELSAEEKQVQLMQDIERARRRREEKDRAREEMERLRAEELRLREAAAYGDWQQKEEEFHLAQTQVRSTIRLLERREQPIDLLAENVLLIEAAESNKLESKQLAFNLSKLRDAQLKNPLDVIHEVESSSLDALLSEIENYLELARVKGSAYLDFWTDLREVTLGERRMRANRRNNKSLHKAVVEDVRNLLKGKSSSELLEMEEEIRNSLKSGERVDVEYWEQVLDEIRYQRYLKIVSCRFEAMLERQREAISQLAALEGSFPKRAENEHMKMLKEAKQLVKEESLSSAEREFLQAEQEKGLGENEELMGVRDEFPILRRYSWEDKYAPRKPVFYNRIMTGFDWNLYNQTHYDADSPPPKIVMGYKFTIFYPDLVDPYKAPKYHLEGAEEPSHAVIRFHAGAPYQDIAFTIKNQEWDVDRRGGFVCTFEGGILRLHFHFRRLKYRR